MGEGESPISTNQELASFYESQGTAEIPISCTVDPKDCCDVSDEDDSPSCTADFSENVIHVDRCFSFEGNGIYTCDSTDVVGMTYATSDCSGTPTDTQSVSDS